MSKWIGHVVPEMERGRGGAGTWTLYIRDQRAGVCSRAESYCCEKINVQGEVFKEKHYTICTMNWVKIDCIIGYMVISNLVISLVPYCNPWLLLTRWKILFMPSFCRIRANLICIPLPLRTPPVVTMLFGYPQSLPLKYKHVQVWVQQWLRLSMCHVSHKWIGASGLTRIGLEFYP